MKKGTIQHIVCVFFSLCIIKGFSFLETVLIAKEYGTSNLSDAFIIAYNVPTVVLSGIGIAISTIYIPQYIANVKNCQESLYFNSNLTSILVIISVFMFPLFYFCPGVMVRIFATGIEQTSYSIAVQLVKIMAFATLPIVLQNLFIGYLQIKQNYTLSTLIPATLNMCIVGYIIFKKNSTVFGLAKSVVIGYFCSFLLLICISIWRGYRYKPYLCLKETYIKEMIFLLFPAFLNNMINQINTIVDKNFASMLPVGCISGLDYSYKIINVLSGLVTASITTVLFPKVAFFYAEGNLAEVRLWVKNSLITILAFALPITIGLIVLARPIIEILFGYGHFGEKEIKLTSECLVAYAVGFSGECCKGLFIKMFYALKNTKKPAQNAIISIILNIALNYILIRHFRHMGVALATSITVLCTTVLLLFSFAKYIREFKILALVKETMKILLSSISMGVVLAFLHQWLCNLLSKFWEMSILVFVGVIVYGITLFIFKFDFNYLKRMRV